MPKVSPEHLDARRAEILEGAQRAFARWGYSGTTVARLEQEIGLSRGAIFHYFHSKKELFAALAVDANRRYARLIVSQGMDAAIREISRESPDVLAVLLEVWSRLRQDEDFQRMMATPDEELAAVGEWFAEQQRAGVFRQDVDALTLGRFATMVTNGLAFRVLAGDTSDVEPTIRLLHDAIGPQPPGGGAGSG